MLTRDGVAQVTDTTLFYSSSLQVSERSDRVKAGEASGQPSVSFWASANGLGLDWGHGCRLLLRINFAQCMDISLMHGVVNGSMSIQKVIAVCQ